MTDKIIKIGIDGNLVIGNRTGMGSVVISVLRNLKCDSKTSIFFYVREPLVEKENNELNKLGINICILGNYNYFYWEQVVLPKAIKKDNIDVFWSPYNTAPLRIGCKLVVTVNDVIYMHQNILRIPTLYKKLGCIYRRIIVPRAVAKSNSIITISKFAKNDIITCFPSAAEKISVIYLAANKNDLYSKDYKDELFFKNNAIKENYILGYASLEKRKNSAGMLKAYTNLPKEIRDNNQLVLFGFINYKDSHEYEYIVKNKLNVVILGYITEEEKEMLYRNAVVFVFPSLAEGFGIPVLEAFNNKVPVITSNTTSLPEVAGDAALLVNPENIDEIKNAIITVLKNEALRNEMVAKGEIQAKMFSWKKTAKQIIEMLAAN